MATEGANVGRALLLGTGLLFLLAALLYDPRLLAPLAHQGFEPLTLHKLERVRMGFGLAGAVLVGLSQLARRMPRFGRMLSRRGVAFVLLVASGLAVPLVLLDCGLRPFVDPKTTIYLRDPELGWKLAPGASDEYGGARVQINARGLRGPELPDARTPGTLRILWLGDSVTFGYGVERVEETFPYRVAAQLGAQLGRPLESVAAGVGGYAPWQERIWLEREGWHYAPDLVVVGFVLNDLTEPLSLVRYGGQGEGWQLARSAHGALDRWLSASALVTFMREGLAALRFGRDVTRGANALDAFDVKRLVADPGAALWQRSWRNAEQSLAAIFDAARQRGVPAALVIFPYAFQLEAPEQRAEVQRRVAAFAQAEGVPVLDLLPALAARGLPGLFLDESHLSPAGHAASAELIADFLARHELPEAGRAKQG